jgi:hypothetical protein
MQRPFEFTIVQYVSKLLHRLMLTQLSGYVISLRLIFEVRQPATKSSADTLTADNITIKSSYSILVIIVADNVYYKDQNVLHNESKIIQS